MAEKKTEDTQETPQPKEDTRNVYQRMLGVARDTDGVVKDGNNTEQRYKYASHDAVVSAVREAMVKHGVIYLVDTLSMEEVAQEVAGKYGTRTVYVAKGHFHVIVINADAPDDRYPLNIYMTAQDSGDKAGAKLLSYVKKYGLLACVGLLLPTGIDLDDDKGKGPSREEQEQDERYAERERAERARTAAKQQKDAPKTPNATTASTEGKDTPEKRKRFGMDVVEAIQGFGLEFEDPWKKFQESLGPKAPKLPDLALDDYELALTKIRNNAKNYSIVLAHAKERGVPEGRRDAAIENAGIKGGKWWTATADQLRDAYKAVQAADGKKAPAPAEGEAEPEPSEPEPREPGSDDDLPFGE